jgi:hypothetical protein
MDHWVEHSSGLLKKITLVEEEVEENENTEIKSMEEEIIPPPMLTEVKDQIQILRKNKAPGDVNMTVEMMRYAGNGRSDILIDPWWTSSCMLNSGLMGCSFNSDQGCDGLLWALKILKHAPFRQK